MILLILEYLYGAVPSLAELLLKNIYIPDLATKLQFCGKRNSVLLSNTEPGWIVRIFFKKKLHPAAALQKSTGAVHQWQKPTGAVHQRHFGCMHCLAKVQEEEQPPPRNTLPRGRASARMSFPPQAAPRTRGNVGNMRSGGL